jgi:hypothetical protein
MQMKSVTEPSPSFYKIVRYRALGAYLAFLAVLAAMFGVLPSLNTDFQSRGWAAAKVTLGILLGIFGSIFGLSSSPRITSLRKPHPDERIRAIEILRCIVGVTLSWAIIGAGARIMGGSIRFPENATGVHLWFLSCYVIFMFVGGWKYRRARAKIMNPAESQDARLLAANVAKNSRTIAVLVTIISILYALSAYFHW